MYCQSYIKFCNKNKWCVTFQSSIYVLVNQSGKTVPNTGSADHAVSCFTSSRPISLYTLDTGEVSTLPIIMFTIFVHKVLILLNFHPTHETKLVFIWNLWYKFTMFTWFTIKIVKNKINSQSDKHDEWLQELNSVSNIINHYFTISRSIYYTTIYGSCLKLKLILDKQYSL